MNMTVPLIPTFVWILATALGIIILLVIFGGYLFQRREIARITGLKGSVADLTAQKNLLNSDVERLEKHILGQKEELLRVDSERKNQESRRIDLDTMVQKIHDIDVKHQTLRTELGQLEFEQHHLSGVIPQMNQELDSLTTQRDAASEELTRIKAEIPLEKEGNARELSEIEAEHKKFLEDKKDFLNKKIAKMKEEALPIIEEHKKLKGAFEEDLAHHRDVKKEIADAKVYFESLIEGCERKESQIAKTTASITTLENQRRELEQDINKIEIDEAELLQLQTQFTELTNSVHGLENKIQELNAEGRDKERWLSDIQNTIESLQDQKNQLGKAIKELEIDEAEFRQFQEQFIELTDGVAALKKKEQNLLNACSGQKTILDQISDSIAKRKKQLNDVQDQLRIFDQKYQNLLQIEVKEAELQRAVSRLEIEKNRLQECVNALEKKLTTTDAPGLNPESFKDLLLNPVCLHPTGFSDARLSMTEDQALQKFKDQLATEGKIFHERVINSFHTSLKCADINPLTVLAGVSGTGKTLLPIKYAQLMGMHSLVMAVQPRWDSPQDMFGFYNYLEKKYKATDFAQALVRMDEYHKFEGKGGTSKDRMLLVLMDEMNLARTEYYFSEFLSKLELRRDVKTPTDPSDRERAEIVLDLGTGNSALSRIWVGGNVLFVGTMNEDETTQSLSDKVLDRSNVLRFGKPAQQLTNIPKFNEHETAEAFMTQDLWNSWRRQYNDRFVGSDDVAQWTGTINSALQKIGRPFGFRTEKAIRAYVANYPMIGVGNTYKLSFADQIEQKILPKLRGLELSDNMAVQCLTDIGTIIEQLGDDSFSKAFNEARQPNHSGMFIWHGVSRI